MLCFVDGAYQSSVASSRSESSSIVWQNIVGRLRSVTAVRIRNGLGPLLDMLRGLVLRGLVLRGSDTSAAHEMRGTRDAR